MQRDSMLGGAPTPTSAGSSKRGRRSQGGGGGNLRSSIGNGLVLETLEEELRFGNADAIKAKLQLDLVRACIRLRCTCIPYIGAEMNKVFALPEEQEKHAGLLDSKAASAASAATDKNKLAAAAGGLLSRTKSSLMTKLFTVSTEKDSDPPSHSALPGSGDSNTARSGTSATREKKKLALMDVLKQAVKISNVELFEQNLRETIAIEDQAATTYVNIKTKEIRTTIFAGFALLVHNEMTNTWQKVPGGGAMARIPVHVARVLFTLGNEKRMLAEQLDQLRVLRGENAPPPAAAAAASTDVTTTATNGSSSGPPGIGAGASASRSLFGAADDSGSDSDDGDDGRVSAKKAFCEALLYRDHLYKQLCAGVLKIYVDLIARLRSNSFLDSSSSNSDSSSGSQRGRSQRRAVAGRPNNRIVGDMFTTIAEGNEGEAGEDSGSSDGEGLPDGATKTPYCLGQAIEELAYLKVSLHMLIILDSILIF